jgi:hypothetical protein
MFKEFSALSVGLTVGLSVVGAFEYVSSVFFTEYLMGLFR